MIGLLDVKLLLLLFLANGAPIIAHKLLGRCCAWPLDGGMAFFDKRPLFGPSKTVRGVVAALLVTTSTAPLLGLPVGIGFTIGLFAMAGDLLSSFVKRRLGLAPSEMALGLDQIPETLFPLAAVRLPLGLGWERILLLVVAFLVLGLVVSRVLYWLNIRQHPY